MRNQGPLKSSLNAGELSPDLKSKVGLRQFYSGAARLKNLEPVPQSGCQLAPGSTYVDTARDENIRMYCLPVNAVSSLMLFFTPGKIDIYRSGSMEKVKTITTDRITAERLPTYEFYAEANTVGIFHEDDATGIRLLRTTDTDWTVDDWPYESKPRVDLGRNDYPKTTDTWQIYMRYTDDTSSIVVQLSVDGQKTTSVAFVDSVTGDNVAPVGASLTNYNLFATNMQTALRALPDMTSGLTVEYLDEATENFYRVFEVTFGGSLVGSSYEFDCTVVNTSLASTLVAHIDTGKTTFEYLISADRGGFSGLTLWQDRGVYWAPNAEKAALSISQTGEYFKLDDAKIGDNYAILTRLRTQTSEKIYAVEEDTYLLVFTDKGEWFVNNRTVKQSEPLNFITASRIGTRRGVKPQKFDGKMWFISKDGSTLYTIEYDAVGESYVPTQADLLATHLVNKIRRQWVQRKVADSATSRLWLARDDGRLVFGVSIRDQEINAFAEWVPADSGFVLDICPDGADRMWLTVKRGDLLTIERMDEAKDNLFHCAFEVTTDLTGMASGLGKLNGRQVWARIDGYIDGPFTVGGGTIQTGFAAKPAQIGLWQPPVFESMPYWKVLPNDEILVRPARIHTVTVNLLDTESVAVGVNGRSAKDVSLLRTANDITVAPPPYDGAIELAGLQGCTVGPSVVITQTRPGRLRIRDYMPGIKF